MRFLGDLPVSEKLDTKIKDGYLMLFTNSLMFIRHRPSKKKEKDDPERIHTYEYSIELSGLTMIPLDKKSNRR
jgi:hypothetical protein